MESNNLYIINAKECWTYGSPCGKPLSAWRAVVRCMYTYTHMYMYMYVCVYIYIYIYI